MRISCTQRVVMVFIHRKCRCTEVPYLNSAVHRNVVPDDKVSWENDWPNYSPPDYTDSSIKGKPWADLEIFENNFKWNQQDGKIERTSYTRKYNFDDEGRPLNPLGRTGIRGRGLLGRWGPNHAADPIVTRYFNGVLQFVAIKRHDTGEWAIPGGMVDAGEKISETLKREFHEEALEGIDPTVLKTFWDNGEEIYRGYVDDPRNTDNAWMETLVMNFHDADNVLQHIELKAGDDASSVKWMSLTDDTHLYASHKYFISLLKEKRTKLENQC